MLTAEKVIEELLSPFWKQGDLAEYSEAERRLKELEGTYTTHDNSPEDQEAYDLTWNKKKIEMRVSQRYILSFEDNPESVFKDMQLILDAATKEEYLEHLDLFVRFKVALDDAYNKSTADEKRQSNGYYSMISFLAHEGYKTCFLFLQGLIADQITVVRHYIEKEKPNGEGDYLEPRVAELIHRKAETWYKKPADVNIHEPITSDLSPYLPTDLKEENFYKVVHGKPTDALASLNKKKAEKNPIKDITIFNKDLNNKVEISCKNGELGISAHKLLTKALSEFTSNNPDFKYLKKGEKPNRHVSFPLKEYARETGYKVDPRPALTKEEEDREKKKAKNALDNARKTIKNDLLDLQSTVFTWEEHTKNMDGSFENINLFSSSRYNRKTKNIEISFTEEIAEYLARRNTLTHTPKALSKVDPRKPNVYSLGTKIYQHYDNYTNIIKGTNDRLGVKTLLKVTNLPSYEEVQQKDRGHWQKRIKEPFEKALDELKKMGLLNDWRYVKGNAEELTEEEAYNITDYATFSKLYILFDPAEKIDNEEQIENKKEEIAKNKEKKEKAHQKALAKVEYEKIKSGK